MCVLLLDDSGGGYNGNYYGGGFCGVFLSLSTRIGIFSPPLWQQKNEKFSLGICNIYISIHN